MSPLAGSGSPQSCAAQILIGFPCPARAVVQPNWLLICLCS